MYFCAEYNVFVVFFIHGRFLNFKYFSIKMMFLQNYFTLIAVSNFIYNKMMKYL